MQTFTRAALVATAGLLSVAAAPARAEQPGPISLTQDMDHRLRLGVTAAPMPLGTVRNEVGTYDAALAFGAAPSVDFLVVPYLTVGFAPQVVFNVKKKDGAGDPGLKLDLYLRIGYWLDINEKVSFFTTLSPGYSIVRPAMGANAKGFVLGLAGGLTVDLTERIFALGHLGYDFGFQKVASVDHRTGYLNLGVGLGMRL